MKIPKKTENSLVVGLDIGTSKIVAIVGEMQADGSVEVIGLGSHPSRGLKRGVVVDMASTEQAIQRAVEERSRIDGGLRDSLRICGHFRQSYP
jgi:cell division protein FtsA